PVNLIGGWYDIFLPSQLDDYKSLKTSGKIIPYLTIGPWTHQALGGFFTGLKESISFFDAHLRDEKSKLRKDPVRIYVMGRKRWLDLADWPPSEMELTRWNLHANKILDQKSPADSQPDTYDYDPKNPTPSVGGVVLGANAGLRDNRRLEARSDVLSYTSTPVEKDYTIIGPVFVDLYVKSSLENTDFFARLCDVSPDRKSINICDGLIRLRPFDFAKDRGLDGVTHITFDLWPTAYSFLKGNRIRLQVSSGSHPRFARNLGSGEPLATATNFKVAHQQIFHDVNRPSSIILPVYNGRIMSK
ncbi:MAG: CocE/NonD family hydrolase, partial [Nitrososphaerales archaeon]